MQTYMRYLNIQKVNRYNKRYNQNSSIWFTVFFNIHSGITLTFKWIPLPSSLPSGSDAGEPTEDIVLSQWAAAQLSGRRF